MTTTATTMQRDRESEGAGIQAIHVETRRVVLSGERSARLRGRNGKLLGSDAPANRALRFVELPSEVVPSRATTVLEDGILTIELPKLEEAD